MDEATKAEIERLHDENVRQNHRIDNLENKVEKLNEITVDIKELTINMTHMVEAQTQMKADLEEIKLSPGNNWTSMTRTIFNNIIGAMASAIGIGLLMLMYNNM